MKNIFNTPQEAIVACESEFLVAWSKFAIANNIIPEVNAKANELTKNLFKAGFMNGAEFVISHILQFTPKPSK